MNYHVVNMMNSENWEGQADNAKEVYRHITINKGDTTVLQKTGASKKFTQTFVKEW